MTATTASTPDAQVTGTPVATYGLATHMDPGFAATLKSEWTKLRSLRSTWIVVALAIGLSIGVSTAIALVIGLTSETRRQADQTTFDLVMSSMAGLLFSLILLIVLGVTAVTSEYSSGMIRTTFIVNPHRIRVFAAKAIIVGLLGVVVHAIAVPGMFLASQALYGSYGLETARVTDSEVTRYLIVVALVVPLIYILISFAFAWLLRGTASAITAAIGFIFLPYTLAPLLPVWIQQHVLRYLPDLAADSLSGLTPPDAVTYLSPVPAMIVVVTWIIGSLVAATVLLNRRDV
jgi:ABC-2 type transport system permease protein